MRSCFGCPNKQSNCGPTGYPKHVRLVKLVAEHLNGRSGWRSKNVIDNGEMKGRYHVILDATEDYALDGGYFLEENLVMVNSNTKVRPNNTKVRRTWTVVLGRSGLEIKHIAPSDQVEYDMTDEPKRITKSITPTANRNKTQGDLKKSERTNASSTANNSSIRRTWTVVVARHGLEIQINDLNDESDQKYESSIINPTCSIITPTLTPTLPSPSSIPPTTEESNLADDLLQSYDESQNHLNKQRLRKKRRSTAQLQQRLRARQRIKETKALRNVPVFAGLSPEATQKIVDRMEYTKISANHSVVEQNAIADRFFVVVSGQCRVEVRATDTDESCLPAKRVGTLHALDFFGENALLDHQNSNRARNATVIAEIGVVQLLSLSTLDFVELFEAGILDSTVVDRMREATRKRRKTNEAKMKETFEEKEAPTSETASRFNIDDTRTNNLDRRPSNFMLGHEKIEEELKRQIDKQRQTSVNRTQMRILARQRLKQTNALTKIPIFQLLEKNQIEQLIEGMEYKTYPQGAKLCAQGETADRLFVLLSGQCKVSIRMHDKTEERRVGTLYELDFVGEGALLGLGVNTKDVTTLRTATVTSEIGTVQALELRREKFQEIFQEMLLPEGFMNHMEDLASKRRLSNAKIFKSMYDDKAEGNGAGEAERTEGAEGRDKDKGEEGNRNTLDDDMGCKKIKDITINLEVILPLTSLFDIHLDDEHCVKNVSQGSNASNAGLIAKDQILSVNGVSIHSKSDLARACSGHDTVVLVVSRRSPYT